MCDLLNLTILTPFIAHCWFQKCGKCEIICQNVMLVWRLTVFYFYFDSLAFFHAKSLFLRSCFFIIHTILVVMVQPVYTHSQNHYVVRLLRTWGRWNFVMNFEMYINIWNVEVFLLLVLPAPISCDHGLTRFSRKKDTNNKCINGPQSCLNEW